ncbi:MAG: ABC transporter permease [Bdellovibrio sp.]|nr:ABC transporter permease [Bdellovibrio sp.]
MSLQRLAPWFGFLFGLALSCLLALFFNESPLHVLKIVTTSFLNSKFDFGLTLFYTTCFIFSGLAFSIPLRAGLFHIGAEGQLTISAVVAAVLGSILPTHNWFGILIIFVITALTGMLSALIIALFKYYRKAHEVVVAIMLNFIFAAISTWLTINHFQNPNSQNPETAMIADQFQIFKSDPLKIYFDQSPISLFFIVAVAICIFLYWLEPKILYFQVIKSYGANRQANQRFGFSEIKILATVMLLAGFFSAFIGLTEVMGNTYQYKLGFSPAYGFLGIAVALLARQHFLGLIASSFLVAILHKGASDLDLETQFLTRDFSQVLQALIIFSVAASYFFFSRKKIKVESEVTK